VLAAMRSVAAGSRVIVPHAKAVHARVDVGPPGSVIDGGAGGLTELAVVDDIYACFALLPHHAEDGGAQAGQQVRVGSVVAVKADEVRRAREATGVGREDAPFAAFHEMSPF